MLDWFDKYFVEEWHLAWKRWSVWLSGLFGTGVTALLANPSVLFSIVNFMPTDPTSRFLAALGVGIFFAAAPIVTVLLKQRNLARSKPNEPSDPPA